jgi:hypothetical protein
MKDRTRDKSIISVEFMGENTVFTASKSSNKKLQRRRNFLSRAVAVGGMAVLDSSVGQAQATIALTKGSLAASPESRGLWQGNATVNDFSSLVSQRFRFRTKDDTTSYAKLIEANPPKIRHALRFRREHYSVVFDIPGSVELVQGRYRISHPQIDSMDYFMAPLDLPEKYNRLEAVFT